MLYLFQQGGNSFQSKDIEARVKALKKKERESGIYD